MTAPSYFDHNARRPSWELVEVEPVMVDETDDEAEVERVRQMWRDRIERNG